MRLRYTIILAIVVVNILSFILTGVYFSYYYKKESEIYHLERIRRKEYSIKAAIAHHIKEQKLPKIPHQIAAAFNQKICEISDIHNVDIAFYNLNGTFLTGAVRNPIDKDKLFVFKLDSLVLETIFHSFSDRVTIKKNIENRSYLYDYFFLHDDYGEEILIINIPYLLDKNFFNREMKNFLLNLVQIYFVLFLIAIAAAILLATTITKPLDKLRALLKNNVKIEEAKPIEGQYPSEIQQLVDDYNRVLQELKNSAMLLAERERDSAWRDVARQVAHEIKNPITPMRLSVQWIERTLQTNEPDKLKEFCTSMLVQIDTLSRIADTFSRYSKLPEISFEKINLCEIARQTSSLLTDQPISIITPKSPVYIIGDKNQLTQALNNVLKNAIQATEDRNAPEIKIEVSDNSHEAAISITDNGCGIEPELLDKIFIPKFTTKTSGMGLGLAIVKNIVEAHRGRIDLQSVKHKGTTIKITLPKNTEYNGTHKPDHSKV